MKKDRANADNAKKHRLKGGDAVPEVAQPSKKSSETNNDKMIRTIIKKLMKYNSTSITDLPELLDMLDKGYDVNLSDFGDDYIKHKLYKLFKLFGLVHDSRNKYSFKKGRGTNSVGSITKQNQSMKEHVLALIDEYKKEAKPNTVQNRPLSDPKRVCVRPDPGAFLSELKDEKIEEERNEEEEAWIQLIEDKEEEKPIHEEMDKSYAKEKESSPKSLFEDHKLRMRRIKKREEKQRKVAGKIAAGISFSQGDAFVQLRLMQYLCCILFDL
eukprot:TRINITY_DN502_c0_g1_i1.p2 TRINITY_DN502_c0_g1~~TRINITY_DN502_c0_g1_i1.p2  ORF type:complete len:270 (+),score=40.76 TRINITY_DN502_c0_g1_i1:2073-2882(+)